MHIQVRQQHKEVVRVFYTSIQHNQNQIRSVGQGSALSYDGRSMHLHKRLLRAGSRNGSSWEVDIKWTSCLGQSFEDDIAEECLRTRVKLPL